ncbi:DUF6297 family protein [Kocuria sp. CPCC 205268]|uniref:DUF6297 family protein n=1 Tax=Kocuria oxytropis TaxID=3058913 RepID=UPI0034D7B161
MSPTMTRGAQAPKTEPGTTAFDPWHSARTTAKQRAHRPLGERLTDLYIRIFSLAVVGSMAASLLQFTSATTAGATTSWLHHALITGTSGLPSAAAAALGAFCLAALGVWVLLATGPIAAARADLVWGFQLPVDRSPFLRRALTGVLARGFLVAAAAATVAALIILTTTGPTWTLIPMVLTITALGPAAAAAAVIAQTRSTSHGHTHRLARVLPWTVAGTLLGGAAYGLLAHYLADAPASPALNLAALGGTLGPVPAVVLVLAATTLIMLLHRRARHAVTRLDWPQLEASGGNAMVFRAAAATFDLQDLYRALIQLPHIGHPPSSLIPRGPTRPWVALWRAETTGWLRLSGPLPLWLAALGAMLMIATVPGAGTVTVLSVALSLTALLAADLAASATRTSALTPDVEAILPISSTAAQIARLLTPCLAMALWGAITLGILGALTGTALLTLPGTLAGLGLGATAATGARRPPLDWSGAVIMTDSGAIPIGVISQLTAAHTCGLLVLVPTLIALIAGTITLPLLGLQVVLSAGAIIWALRRPRAF